MGSLAASRLAVEDDLPPASIADQVATIARKNLAPMAAAIDAGDRLSRRTAPAPWRCRRLGKPSTEEWRSRSALRHSIDRRARRSLRRDRLHGVVSEHAGLVRREFEQSKADRQIRRQIRDRANPRRHRSFQSDEELLRNRETETEGPQGRWRLRRQGRAALGVKSRARPFLRHASSSARTSPAAS